MAALGSRQSAQIAARLLHTTVVTSSPAVHVLVTRVGACACIGACLVAAASFLLLLLFWSKEARMCVAWGCRMRVSGGGQFLLGEGTHWVAFFGSSGGHRGAAPPASAGAVFSCLVHLTPCVFVQCIVSGLVLQADVCQCCAVSVMCRRITASLHTCAGATQNALRQNLLPKIVHASGFCGGCRECRCAPSTCTALHLDPLFAHAGVLLACAACRAASSSICYTLPVGTCSSLQHNQPSKNTPISRAYTHFGRPCSLYSAAVAARVARARCCTSFVP